MNTLPHRPVPPFCRNTSRVRRQGRLFLLLLMMLISLTSGEARAQGEIDITQSGNTIISGSTFDFGSVGVGTPVTRTFTIRNTGNFQLGVSGISKTGTNANNYSYTNPGNGTILANSTTTFTLTFTPSAAGTRIATFNITNTDSNENPYVIRVTGTGLIVPEIAVSQSGANMTDGFSTVNFGSVNIGITANRTFNIRNNGLADLTGLSLSLSGGSAWSASTLNVNSLASGLFTSFTVSFAPTSSSSSTASLTIFSNDADEGSFTISLTGTGVVPIMTVEAPAGTPLFDGGDTVTIPAPVGGSAQRTFTIRNVSGGSLTGLALTLDGAGAADFVTGSLPTPTLAASEVMTFTVTFNATALADSVATLHIASDQAPGDAFDINLTGSGVNLPDLGDEDGDGAANMLEKATGNDPFVAGPHPGVLVKNGNILELTFNRRSASLSEVGLSVEWTDELSDTWTVLDISAASLLDDNGTLQLVRYSFPAGSTGRRFVRIRATRP